jgi:signal transduction histidine kinase
VRKFSFLIVCLVVLSALAQGQSPFIDSLRQQIAASTNEKRVDLLNKFGYIRLSYDYLEAKALIEEAFTLSKKLSYARGLAEATYYKGIIELNTGLDSISQGYFRDALRLAGPEPHLQGKILTRIGQIKQNEDLLDSAWFYYQRSYSLLKDSLDPLSLSYLYIQMADFYKARNDHTQELNYLKRCWEIRRRQSEKHPLVWVGVDLEAYYMERGDYTAARTYLTTIRKELGSDTVGNEEISVIYKYNAILDASLGHHTRALDEFAVAKRFYERNPFPMDLARLLMEIGFVQAQSANFETGLKYYFQAYRIARENRYRRLEAQLSFRIARGYYFMNQLDLAEEFCRKSLTYAARQNFELDEAMAANLMGTLSLKRQKFEDAKRYFERALELRKKNNNLLGVAGALGNLGELYDQLNELEKAEEYELEALEIAESADFASGKCYSYVSLGQLYLKKKDYARAANYLDKGEAFARQINYKETLVSIYKLKKELWRAQGDAFKALRYADLYENLHDSIFNKNMSNRILSLRHDFELDQKENEIKLLNQQKELQSNKLEAQKSEIRQQRMIIITGIVVLIIVMGGSYVIFRFYKKVDKLNRAISEQNEEIMAQSEELREANDVLENLNREITEQKEEIQAQAEELIESNQVISRINENLESKIQERTQELKEAYRELDTFFYRSSHDFRRPLTTFMGLAEVAKVTLKDSFALELFGKVNETARSLDKMLSKLQSVSLIGSQELVYSEVLLKEMVQVELDSFRNTLLEKSIEVKIELDHIDHFYSYPALVKIIFQNLIENAVSFCKTEDAWIMIKARRSGQHVILEVSDNGQGIEDQYLSRVSEMYFRANEKSKGNGLGLYIVKKIVDKLKGTIEVQSIYGEGTSVIVSIPNQWP